MERRTEDSKQRLLLLIKIIYVPAIIALSYFGRQLLPQIELWQHLFFTALLLIVGQIAIHKLPPQIVFYLFFGVLTTLVAQLSFNAVNWLISGSWQGLGGFWWFIPHSVSWSLAVLFAFITNRFYVFQAEQGKLWTELKRFVIARLGSGLLIEVLGMFILVNLIGLAQAWSKLLTSILVVIANFVVSKLFVFKENNFGKTSTKARLKDKN